MMVPVGSPGTSAKPTFVPFGTAVAEQAESGSVPSQPWSTVSLPGKQLDIVIITLAVPADRKPNGGDVCCDRLLNSDRDTGRRTYFGAGDLHRATSNDQQQPGQ